jgi:ribosomal protein L11 methylase PrmA
MIIHCNTTRYIWEVLENKEYSFLFNDLVVVDLGCNIGTFSLSIYPCAKEIHAVDMEQEHIDLFNKTIKDNELHSVYTYTERVKDLGGFLSGHSIPVVDLLKVDIEGDEHELFINNFPIEKVRTIVGEYHNRSVRGLLEDLGYRYFEHPNQHFVARI